MKKRKKVGRMTIGRTYKWDWKGMERNSGKIGSCKIRDEYGEINHFPLNLATFIPYAIETAISKHVFFLSRSFLCFFLHGLVLYVYY
jgi:hypothetical protein